MTEPTPDPAPAAGFRALELPDPLLRALVEVGYESPSPIQAQTIPHLLGGRDLLGQAQTGTGKTAAFALPILARLDLTRGAPQALVLAPTRELGIQVAEAFHRYAAFLPGFHVLPIYGGQSYGPQLNALRRGVHVVVGTPGRVLDHLERGSLDLSQVRCVVLDEADEMLRMGFIDDVEAILGRAPTERQTALFSATLPPPIRRIAQTYLKDPVTVTIDARQRTAAGIRQRYWMVSGLHKLDALTRILEAEPFDAMIVFTRTRQSTDELAEKLQARGFAAAAINGDLPQAQRERTISQLRDGKIDILVATDVAARGLDVDRISHVLNFDVPYDAESYVHRIGRTGRAGRTGEAILFVAPRERNLLRSIEHATRQPIERMELPTIEAVNDVRIGRFKQQIQDALAAGGLEPFQRVVEDFEREHNVPAIEIAAALARLARGDVPLLLQPPVRPVREHFERPQHGDRQGDARPRFARDDRAADDRPRPPRADRDDGDDRPRRERFDRNDRNDAADDGPPRAPGLFRVEVGHAHGVRPGNLVGAIANEAGLSSRDIGRIDIRDDFTLIELPRDLQAELLRHLEKVWVGGQQLRISRADDRDLGQGRGGGGGGDRPPEDRPRRPKSPLRRFGGDRTLKRRHRD